MKKICVVAGARPNFMKVAPLIREFKKNTDVFECVLVHTGQHYDRDMSEVFFEELEIPPPDVSLGVGGGTHAQQTARVMIAFEEYCLREKPDLVVVVGDVNSTMACSIVAKKLNTRLAHVEAGLRSGDMGMPEEINRIVTDSLSDFFFVTEGNGVSCLLAEGKPKSNIHFVGHVMIDNLLYQMDKLRRVGSKGMISEQLKLKFGRYGVVTLHRPSNVDDRETLQRIVRALNAVSERLPLIFPVHPRTRKSLDRFDIAMASSILLTTPLSYLEFLNLWSAAAVVLTDSGGIQEETTALGVPCVTLRENTERPVTVSEGTNTLVGSDPEAIVAIVEEICSGRAKTGARPALWDGRAAHRIIATLREYERVGAI